MTASTEAFLALQRLYRERMEADAAAVEARAAALLKKLGRDTAQLRRGAVRQFVKNARNLRCGPPKRSSGQRHASILCSYSASCVTANLPLLGRICRVWALRVMPCRVVRWRRLGEAAAGQGNALRAALSGEDTCANAGLLLLLRAVDLFHAAHGRFPGTYDGCGSPLPTESLS